MNATIRFLADFCRRHPLDEKAYVAPSFIVGRQIGEALAREAGSWVNLRFVTPWSLAGEVLERSGRPGPGRPMTSAAELALTDRLARELRAEGRLDYLGRGGLSPGLTEALRRAIRDLRLAGLAAADVRPELFLVERKGRELGLLAARFERALAEGGLLDQAAFLAAAARAAETAPPRPFWTLCPRDASLSRLERDFLRAAAGDRLVLVPGDPVFGLERPRHFWPAPDAAEAGEDGSLSRLFDPGGATGPAAGGRIAIFRALGPANECREVLRRLYEENVPFDRAEVLAPDGSAHATAFYLLAARTGLPVTFGEGVPVSFTSPGRLFFGLLDWVGNDFSSAHLGRLLENGDLVLPEGPSGAAVAGRTACRHLRSALIGWGRERYLPRLQALREACEADLARLEGGAGDEGGEAGEARRAALAASVAEMAVMAAGLERLLAAIPGPDPAGGLDAGAVAEALAGVLRERGRAETAYDVKARAALLDRLDELRQEGRFAALPPKEALELVRTAGSSLRVGESPALPGHLHVSGFSTGGRTGREVVFVVGLDEATFPGRGLQDPILLDEERAALSDALPRSADALRGRLYGLAATLASLRGRVVFSYPSFDLIDGRASFPSSIVLQAFRLGRGDPGLDYAALERGVPDAAGFLPGGADRSFDEIDWWLERLAGSGPPADGPGTVAANFGDLAAGLAAAAARAGEKLTPFEGLVDIGPVRAEVDPTAGGRAVMSASRLELLARCPFAYFLRHVLRVEAPREVAFDRSRWLDPLQRGSLIHEALCDFMTRLRPAGEEVSARRHAGLMAEVAGEALARWKREVPPPSEAVFEAERRDILEALAIFMRAEENRDEKGRPVEFELEIARQEIDLGGGRSFFLRGFIDRVDRLAEDAYRVLDYKTGNPAEYEELVEFGRGRMIQHALYAVALERMLAARPGGGRPRVTRSGYLFPSRRGEGLDRIVKDFDRGRLRALLNDLLALIEKGYFIAGPQAQCKYCDYAPVCGPDAPRAAELKREGSPEVFEAYDKLDGYK
ncbi:MAG TPA: PD-(D/E)XK nuclease family protein [Candidatus Aminicenantes bacterium]|nr:PD-(D/E)XK nuclease family protein [Candidatus Aminicenantes bacterium]